MKYIKAKAYINGDFFENNKNEVKIISPLTQEVIGSYPSLSQGDVDFAFKSARQAFKTWKVLKLDKRLEYINVFVKELKTNINSIAEIMNYEIAKDINEAKVEVQRTVEYIEKTIRSWLKLKETHVVIGKKTSIQKRVPLGVVLAISPFNYPINLSLAKIIPALISGNTVVFKAATNGSLVGSKLTELFSNSNFPKGVFNYVTGRGRDIGDILISHSEIDMITFTGSTNIGKQIAKKNFMKPIVLELGGNDAAYVRKDADIENAINEIISGAFSFSGQRCTAIKRVIVDNEIKDVFLSTFKNKMNNITTTPLINKNAFDNVVHLLEKAKANNAKIIYGGTFDKKNNNFHATVIECTTNDEAWIEEAFAPLLPIVFVSSDQEALKIMNDTNFGLQNSIFTSDINWAKSISYLIESGTVNINKKSSRGPDEFPFLGVKNSGFGVQGIDEALKSMTRILNLVVNE